MKTLKAIIDRSHLDKDADHGLPQPHDAPPWMQHAHIASCVKPEGETLYTIRGLKNKPSSLKRELVAAGFEPGEEVVIVSAKDFDALTRELQTLGRCVRVETVKT